jgi:hypothetical protein
MRFGTWNVRRLYRVKSLKILARDLRSVDGIYGEHSRSKRKGGPELVKNFGLYKQK